MNLSAAVKARSWSGGNVFIMSKKRTRSVSLPRQIVMWVAREETQLSLEEIGDHFGGRDHTTVLYAEGKIRDLREQSQEMRSLVDKLTRELQRAGG